MQQVVYYHQDVQEFRTEGLDIIMNNVEGIMSEAIARVEQK